MWRTAVATSPIGRNIGGTVKEICELDGSVRDCLITKYKGTKRFSKNTNI